MNGIGRKPAHHTVAELASASQHQKTGRPSWSARWWVIGTAWVGLRQIHPYHRGAPRRYFPAALFAHTDRISSARRRTKPAQSPLTSARPPASTAAVSSPSERRSASALTTSTSLAAGAAWLAPPLAPRAPLPRDQTTGRDDIGRGHHGMRRPSSQLTNVPVVDMSALRDS